MPKGKRKQQYEAYLKSPEWKKLRQQAPGFSSGRCSKCGKKPEFLVVHHLKYRRNLHEVKPTDLLPLCPDCHNEIHRQKAKVKEDRHAGWERDRRYFTPEQNAFLSELASEVRRQLEQQ